MARLTLSRRRLSLSKIVSVHRPYPLVPPHSYLVPCAKEEAFAAKHMPDLGHEVKEFKVFSWKITNWKKLEKKITSPEFECGGHRW